MNKTYTAVNGHKGATAATISALLRRSGFNPLGSGTPRSREGLRVSQSLREVYVLADLDADEAAARMASGARQAIEVAGYAIRESTQSNSFYVTGRI